jgi:hypothetical protein
MTENGILVPDNKVLEVLKIVDLDSTCINGFPRTVEQCKHLLHLKKKYDVILVVLDIYVDTAEKRLLKRI